MYKSIDITQRVKLYLSWEEDTETISITPAIILQQIDNYTELAVAWGLSLDFLKGAIGIEWRRH